MKRKGIAKKEGQCETNLRNMKSYFNGSCKERYLQSIREEEREEGQLINIELEMWK